jgi:hypothetical protein
LEDPALPVSSSLLNPSEQPPKTSDDYNSAGVTSVKNPPSPSYKDKDNVDLINAVPPSLLLGDEMVKSMFFFY